MSFYRNIGGMSHPSFREELIEEISIRLDKGQTNLNDIDTSKITDMSFLFTRVKAKDLSHIDISLWNTSNVESMACMFLNCYDFTSDLSKWDTSKVAIMYSMFRECKRFNSDLSRWNVSNVIDMEYMFYGCEEFNCYTLSNWKPKSIRARVEDVSV